MTLSRIDETSTIRFGTRGSRLALEQSRQVLELFHQRYPERATELVVVETQGDLDRVSSLQEIGGRGVFTSAIERAVFDGVIEGAIHCAKDVPSCLDRSVPLVAFPLTDDVRDVLVTRHQTTLAALPPNPVIGSSSRRRAVQIRLLRPDAKVVSIRGNVDTRLRKSEADDLDGVVLAAAGLHRLGLTERISEYFAIEDFVPSPGQGALAIQARNDTGAAQLLAGLNDRAIANRVQIERAFLAAVGVGCTAAVGALAVPTRNAIRFIAMLSDDAGMQTSCRDITVSRADAIDHVTALADEMKRDVNDAHRRVYNGAHAPLEHALSGARVVVTRPRHQAGQLLEILEQRGATALAMPLIRIEPVENPETLDNALRNAATGQFSWVVFTSVNALDAVAVRLDALALEPSAFDTLRIAAVGPATAESAARAGFTATLVGSGSTSAELASDIIAEARPGDRMLFFRSQIGRDDLVRALEGAGYEVEAITAYRTVAEDSLDPRMVEQVTRGEIDAITFSSPSSVQTLTSLMVDAPCLLRSVPAICAGPITAAAARDAGLFVAATSLDPGPEAMAQAVVDTLSRTSRTPPGAVKCELPVDAEHQ